MAFKAVGHVVAVALALASVIVGARDVSATTTTGKSAVGKRPGTVAALELLEAIPVALEHRGGYNRSLFSTSTDADTNRCNTRVAVLRRDSTVPIQTDPATCTVTAGSWTSPYDGLVSNDPSTLDVDHVVSLKEVWDSGAWAWTPARRATYANDLSDPRTLRAVSASSNRSKGDRDPSNWLPIENDQCRFLGDWVAIKARWGLSADQSEWGRLRNVLRARCPGLLVTAPTPVPADSRTPLALATDQSSGATTTAVTRSSSKTASSIPSTVYFTSCAAARAAGAAPLHRGDPGYRSGLDRDGDGTACEH